MQSFTFLLLLQICLSSEAEDVSRCSHEEGEFSPCPEGLFCDFNDETSGRCESCVGLTSNDCTDLGLLEAGAASCAASCELVGCSNEDWSSCSDGLFCDFGSGDSGICVICDVYSDECPDIVGLSSAGSESCAERCETRERCSDTSQCDEERSFCGFDSHTEDGAEGVCMECGGHVHDCFSMGLSDRGTESCTASCDTWCSDDLRADVFVDGIYAHGTHPLPDSPELSVEGPLADCGSSLENCILVDGGICLIQEKEEDIDFYEQVQACENGNGVGAIISQESLEEWEWGSQESLFEFRGRVDISIPSVIMSDKFIANLLENNQDASINITVWSEGEVCGTDCSIHHPCSKGSFCNDGDFGFCENCDAYDNTCYLSGLPQAGAIACAKDCQSTLVFGDCKFCPKDVNFAADSLAARDQCKFCPEGDMKYPDRSVNMYGNHSCWLIDEFYTSYAIDSKSKNCKIAQMMNYVCGCEGPGYVGANSRKKQVALAWVPRISAVLSFMGSLFIIIDVTRSKERRSQIFYQLLVVLSIFDLFGSAAYAFTTLPIPEGDFIYGSRGNKAMCTAQGFFIQLGTTSAFMNVSLAVYYLGTVKYLMEDTMIKRKWWLFIVPILIGFGLAFAGLPFYDNMFLWCNNSADWWPEIPVAIAIIIATIIMAALYLSIYRTEKAVSKYRSGSRENKNSKATLWQCLWYLTSFYLTWPPYLALQYMWSSGRAYSMFGFAIFAGALVPLQGFWNCCTYIRRRMKAAGYKPLTSLISYISASKVFVVFFRTPHTSTQ